MATAPLPSGFAETKSSRRVVGSRSGTALGRGRRSWGGRETRTGRSNPADPARSPACRSPGAQRPESHPSVSAPRCVGPQKCRGYWSTGRLSRRRHHVLRLGLQFGRPLADRRRCLHVTPGYGRPEALHRLTSAARISASAGTNCWATRIRQVPATAESHRSALVDTQPLRCKL